MGTRGAGVWKWAALGICLGAAIIFVGYASHINFRRTLVRSFTIQQGIFAKSLQFAVTEHLREEERDLILFADAVKKAGGDVASVSQHLAHLYNLHDDAFEAVSFIDREAKLLLVIPEEKAISRPATFESVKETIRTWEDRKEAFLSKPYLDEHDHTHIFMIVPSDSLFVVGMLNIEDYMTSHFPAWRGRNLGFVLADAEGDILSMLNTRHETDVMMKRGNILSLSDSCLECHRVNDFEDIRRASATQEVVFSTYLHPERGEMLNRATVSFPLYNAWWSVMILAPFEQIHRAIDRNLWTNVAITLLSLLLVGTLSFVVYRSLSLEEKAKSSEALGSYARQLEEANRLKGFFTDIVRHDLMSPAAVIKGYVDILATPKGENVNREILDATKGAVHRLIEVIESSADISKLEEIERVELTRKDLCEILRESARGLESMIRDHPANLVLHTEGPRYVSAHVLLEDAFSNLISNAVKYSPAGSDIEVGVRDGGESWIAYVKDWGEGIPDADKEKIFSRFERLGKEGIKGSGLGLAIVKRIVGLHGGTVHVEDNPEGGSIFCVSLRKASPPTEGPLSS